MKVKCGRVEFDLNDKDIIFFNGACYMIITRKVQIGDWSRTSSPTLAMTKAKKMIKGGLIIEVELSNPPYIGQGYKYYKISNN